MADFRAGGSRQTEKVRGRRDMRKRKLKAMARKGLRIKKNVGPRLGRGRDVYLCGPCSEAKGVQVLHKVGSIVAFAHFRFPKGKAYLLPKPQVDRPKPLRGKEDAANL